MVRLYGQAMQIEWFNEFICGINTQLGHFKYYNDSKSNRKLYGNTYSWDSLHVKIVQNQKVIKKACKIV